MNDTFLFANIFISCDWKCVSHFDSNSEPTNENDNKFVSSEPSYIRFVFRSLLHAVYSFRYAAERIYIW